jgi:Na+/H+-dicarboxylate symporter
MQKKTPQGIKWDRILTVQLMEELNEIFIMFIRWIVSWTPLAIISLIATAIGKTNGFVEVLSALGFLSLATCLGMVMQFLFCYCPMYFLFKRKNPLSYFKKMAPVFTLAFASASSAATLPVTISCAVDSGEVSQGIANFSLPLGATTNMDGTSIHIVSSCIWLAYYNGIVPTPVNYFLLIFCATLGSMGAAPVPSASIVLIMTSYQTTFGGSGEPPGLGLIMAIDWLIDRFRTMTNICGDLTVAACVSGHTERKLRELSERGDLPLAVAVAAKKLEDLEEVHEQAIDSDHQPKPVN